MKYEFIEGITLADAAARAYGRDPDELFMNSALAMLDLTLSNPSGLKIAVTINIDLSAPDLEALLYDFLNEFLYYRDTRSLILRPLSVKIQQNDSGCSMTCAAGGEEIDRSRHIMSAEIKAVTLHEFRIERSAEGYVSLVVYDL
jgi:SHS2 domain-containing protein